MIETVCPLCKVPRPRDAKQCICNYTFEYDKQPAASQARAGGAGPSRALLAFVALASAVVDAALLNAIVAPADRSRPEVGLLLIAIGVFTACGAIFDWQFFMSNRKARSFVVFFGRTGARFMYAVAVGGFVGAGLVFGLI